MRPPERTFKDFPFRLHRQVGEQPDAVKDLYFERAHEDPGVPQIWAYTDRLSYAPGETVRFHISSSLARFALSITRDGAEPKEVYREDGLTAPFSTAPEDCSVKGCGWPVGHAVQIGADWPSGAYIAAFTGEGPAGPVIHEHLFLVRPAPGQEAPLVLVCATGTWWAYNDWGGSNAYEGITGPEGNLFSPVLSLERPYAKGFVTRPEGSPRIPLRAPLGPMERPHYPHMEWAMASGYSKKCASAGWASYDGPFYEWLEGQGYQVDVIALHDLHTQPELLTKERPRSATSTASRKIPRSRAISRDSQPFAGTRLSSAGPALRFSGSMPCVAFMLAGAAARPEDRAASRSTGRSTGLSRARGSTTAM